MSTPTSLQGGAKLFISVKKKKSTGDVQMKNQFCNFFFNADVFKFKKKEKKKHLAGEFTKRASLKNLGF